MVWRDYRGVDSEEMEREHVAILFQLFKNNKKEILNLASHCDACLESQHLIGGGKSVLKSSRAWAAKETAYKILPFVVLLVCANLHTVV